MEIHIEEALVILISKRRLNKNWLSLQDCYILQCCYGIFLLFSLHFLSQVIPLLIKEVYSPLLSYPSPERNYLSPAAAQSCNMQDDNISLCACVTFKNITCQWQEKGEGRMRSAWSTCFHSNTALWGTPGGGQAWKGYQGNLFFS